MEFGGSLCVLPSHGQTFSDEDEFPSKALQLTSGDVIVSGLDATVDGLKTEAVKQYNSAEAPPIFGAQLSNIDDKQSRTRERRRRRPRRDGVRQYPWQRDRNFIRYEHDSERYRAYRLKQKQNNNQVWPCDVEDCLQYALRVIPVLGRKKEARIDHNNQQGGRNELIRDFIYKWTGKDLGRKQVSSHLQVLKALLSDNKAWMQLVTPDTKHTGELTHRKVYEAYRCIPESESNCLDGAGRHKYAQLDICKGLSPPTQILGSNAPPFIHRVDFEMFLDDRDNKRLHTFTSIQSEIGSALRPLEDVYGWERSFPHLAGHYNQHGHISSELILLETNIDLLRDQPPRGSTLGVNPFIVVAGGSKYQNWHSTTRLYERGLWVRDTRKEVELDKHPQRLEAESVKNSQDTKVILQIKSQWWAYNVIAEILTRITKARAQGDQSAVYQAEQWGRQFLSEMSMMQEITATANGEEAPQTIALLLWKFRQTKPRETATTTWRRLTPPSPWNAVDMAGCSEDPLLPQLPVALDYTQQDEFEPHYAPYNDEGVAQPSFFVDDPESIIRGQLSEANSTSSTPTPDMQSLPSSTATSFASSGSGSLLSVNCSTNSCQGYEDSAYHSQEAHNAQDMLYHDSFYHSQDLEYGPQRIEYLHSEISCPDLSEPYSSNLQDNEGVFPHPGQQTSQSVLLEAQSFCGQRKYSDRAMMSEISLEHAWDLQDGVSPSFDHPVESRNNENFAGGHINISFADYRQPHLAEKPDMVSRHPSFCSSHFEDGGVLLGEPEASILLQAGQHQNLHLANRDLKVIDDEAGFEPRIQCCDEETQPFPNDETIHRSQQGELVLHHPQPHQNLQHHLDSAQWQTHALWTSISAGHARNNSEELSPSFKADIPNAQMEVGDEAHEVKGQELPNPVQIIGEVGPDIGNIERDLAREIRRDLMGVDLGD